MRTTLNELLLALERSFEPRKLALGACMGLALALGVLGIDLCRAFFDEPAFLLLLAPAPLLGYAFAAVVLTRRTVTEAEGLRSSRPREAPALLRRAFLLWLAQLVVIGLLVGLLGIPLLARRWLEQGGQALPDLTRAVLACVQLVLEALTAPALALALLLAPILVVEDEGVLGLLRRWGRLLRGRLGWLLTREALALAVAILITLPFLLPLLLPLWQNRVETGLALVTRVYLLLLLGGVALAPFFSYLTVANVHLYLNAQYDFFSSSRDKK
ncbi:MAG: hypothetical protein U0793_32620 [Gemmataceae bacterium]